MGVDRVVAVDLHCGQIQGFFGPRVPVDNLDGGTVGVSYFGDKDLHNPGAQLRPSLLLTAAAAAAATLHRDHLTPFYLSNPPQ